jgi:hypothetical protein
MHCSMLDQMGGLASSGAGEDLKLLLHSTEILLGRTCCLRIGFAFTSCLSSNTSCWLRGVFTQTLLLEILEATSFEPSSHACRSSVLRFFLASHTNHCDLWIHQVIVYWSLLRIGNPAKWLGVDELACTIVQALANGSAWEEIG